MEVKEGWSIGDLFRVVKIMENDYSEMVEIGREKIGRENVLGGEREWF